MLTVIDVLPVEHTTLIVDYYVSFDFQCLDTTELVPNYWRTGDTEFQLLEVGINPLTGAICSLALVGYGKDIIEAEDDDHTASHGIPVCDLGLWSHKVVPANPDLDDDSSDFAERFRDEMNGFRVTFGKSQIRLNFSSDVSDLQWWAAGRVEFGVNRSRQLAAINFTQVSADEMEIIRWKLSWDQSEQKIVS